MELVFSKDFRLEMIFGQPPDTAAMNFEVRARYCGNAPHRLPVHSGRLHGHMSYATLREPVGQPQQIVSEGPKAPLLFTILPLALGP
jgi:hypothetical protein